MNHRWLLILILAVLVTMFPALASAQPPEVEMRAVHEEFNHDCGEFNAIFVHDITLRITTYFDKDGNPSRLQTHVKLDGTVTHSVENKSFRDQAAVNVTQELPLGDKTERGVGVHINVPGHGVVALQVGRIISDKDGQPTFVAGHNWDKDFLALICEGLSDL